MHRGDRLSAGFWLCVAAGQSRAYGIFLQFLYAYDSISNITRMASITFRAVSRLQIKEYRTVVDAFAMKTKVAFLRFPFPASRYINTSQTPYIGSLAKLHVLLLLYQSMTSVALNIA